MKKIAVLHPYLNKKWWAIKMMIYTANSLSRDNHVSFYSFLYEKKYFNDLNINFKINHFNSFNKIISIFKISKRISDYDIIIAWNSPMHLVWILSKIFFRSKAKIIWYNHHYPRYFNKWLKSIPNIIKGYIEKKLVKYIDKIIVNSTYLKKEINNIYNVESYVLNPILDELFLKRRPKTVQKKQNILFTNSRWVEWKNIKTIFEVYEKLKNDNLFMSFNKKDNIKLIIWWDWEELEQYKIKYKNDNNITFLWLINIDEIIDNLLISKIFLFPSKIDSFWMVALESMSMWIPVIAYNKGWITDLINNNKNSFLVDNDKDFYLKTLELFLDDNKYNNFSLNSLKVENKFNFSSFDKKLKKILDF